MSSALRVAIVVPTRNVDQVLAFPPGADEVLLQDCGPPGCSRNQGAYKTESDILLFCDDDILLEGSLDWLRQRPFGEVWWPCEGYADHTGDVYTVKALGFLNMMLELRNIAGVGPVVACRKWAWAAVGGYEGRDVHEDLSFAKRLYQKFGDWPARMPVMAHVYRPNTPPGETWLRRAEWAARELPTDGPFRRLRPATTSPEDTLRPGPVPSD